MKQVSRDPATDEHEQLLTLRCGMGGGMMEDHNGEGGEA